MPEGVPPNVFGDSPLNRDRPFDSAHDFLSPVRLSALHSRIGKDPGFSGPRVIFIDRYTISVIEEREG